MRNTTRIQYRLSDNDNWKDIIPDLAEPELVPTVIEDLNEDYELVTYAMLLDEIEGQLNLSGDKYDNIEFRIDPDSFVIPGEGEPIFLDGSWGLIEKISNEHHAGHDEFVDIYTIRFSDGHQCRLTAKEIKGID